MLSDEDIKQIFFYCDNRDPNGFYADEVDVVEFGKKIAAFVEAEVKRSERGRCVSFVAQTNPELAEKLKNISL